MGGIVIARRPLRFPIVNVLPICRCTEGVIPSTIVTSTIGIALGVSVGHLILQAVTHLLLEDGLQRVVSHRAVRLGPTSYRRDRVVERWVFGKERAGIGARHRRSR